MNELILGDSGIFARCAQINGGLKLYIGNFSRYYGLSLNICQVGAYSSDINNTTLTLYKISNGYNVAGKGSIPSHFKVYGVNISNEDSDVYIETISGANICISVFGFGIFKFTYVDSIPTWAYAVIISQ